MKKYILSVLCLSLFISAPLQAKKPEGVGKGKPSAGQKEMRKTTRKAEEGMTKEVKVKKEKKVKDEMEAGHETPKGIEKQREKKAEQVQKELGKGSETGQEAREKRKKWWRFWE